MKTRGLPRLPMVQARSGPTLTGTLSLLSCEQLFERARTSSSQHLQLGALTTADYGLDDDAEDQSALLLDAAGRYGNAGRWTATLAELLSETDRVLESLSDVVLEVDDDEALSGTFIRKDDPNGRRRRPRAVQTTTQSQSAELDELIARRRASREPWWRCEWRRVFHHHADPEVAREILADVGDNYGASRRGSLVSVEDLVRRFPETSLRAWLVEELLVAGPPTAALAVSLDALAEARDGRPLPREALERLVPAAWTNRAPTVDTPTRWARALLLAMGRPVVEHLLHAVRLVHGPREEREQWQRALAFARAAGVI